MSFNQATWCLQLQNGGFLDQLLVNFMMINGYFFTRLEFSGPRLIFDLVTGSLIP